MIKEDLQKDIAKAHEEEAEGMAAYRELIEESKETIAALNKKVCGHHGFAKVVFIRYIKLFYFSSYEKTGTTLPLNQTIRVLPLC